MGNLYKINNNKIIFYDIEHFNIKDTLECGQVFRFKNIGHAYELISTDKKCILYYENNAVIIETQPHYIDYFINYFDLDRDYNEIVLNNIAFNNNFLSDAAYYGRGIRILNQDAFEIIISFIISANNNIPRIKKIIESLCVNLGAKCDDYYAFPTILEMAECYTNNFIKCGLGYRADYIYNSVNMINSNNFDINIVYSMDTPTAHRYLKILKGIGDKVADCILLFGYHKTDVFPVDTWIDKVYKYETSDNVSNRAKIRDYYVEKYKDMSGYAQQYLFYYKRYIDKILYKEG